MDYLNRNRFKLLAALALCALGALGWLDASAAAMGVFFMGDIDTKGLEILQKALSDHGVSLKAFMDAQKAREAQIADRLRELEQARDRRPGGRGDEDNQPGALTKLVLASEGMKSFLSGNSPKCEIRVPHRLIKAAILSSATLTNDQPLVQAQRMPGIVTGPQRRFTMRDVLRSVDVTSNLVEFARELVYSNQAAPQYNGSSPGAQTEGALKNESSMTFELANSPVVTIAHFIPASRQILSDSPALQRHIEDRLTYGLKLEEESEILTGDNTSGKLNGLRNQQTTFDGGATNQTTLDTLAKAVGQLVRSDYAPSAFVLSPVDWYSSNLLLAKDANNQYLLGNPGNMAEPRLWGIPCVITNSMTAGNFLCMDAERVGYIGDREEAVIRISESHSDWFARNLVAIICEERIALVVEQTAAMVGGSLTFAG